MHLFLECKLRPPFPTPLQASNILNAENDILAPTRIFHVKGNVNFVLNNWQMNILSYYDQIKTFLWQPESNSCHSLFTASAALDQPLEQNMNFLN